MTTGHQTFVGSNIGIHRVAHAFSAWVKHYAHRHGTDGFVDIASGYFNLGGWAELVDVLADVPSVRLLIGTEPDDVGCFGDTGSNTDLRRAAWEMAVLRQFDDGIDCLKHDQPSGSGDKHQVAAVRAIAEADRKGRLRIRKANDSPLMHTKMFIAGRRDGAGRRHGESIMSGSANITRAGLLLNNEFCFSSHDSDAVCAAQRWFDEAFESPADEDDRQAFDLLERYLPTPEQVAPNQVRARTAQRTGMGQFLPGGRWKAGTLPPAELGDGYTYVPQGSGAALDSSREAFTEFLILTNHDTGGQHSDEVSQSRWHHVDIESGDCRQLTPEEAVSVIDKHTPGGEAADRASRGGFPAHTWQSLWDAWTTASQAAHNVWTEEHPALGLDPSCTRLDVFVAVC